MKIVEILLSASDFEIKSSQPDSEGYLEVVLVTEATGLIHENDITRLRSSSGLETVVIKNFSTLGDKQMLNSDSLTYEPVTHEDSE